MDGVKKAVVKPQFHLFNNQMVLVLVLSRRDLSQVYRLRLVQGVIKSRFYASLDRSVQQEMTLCS